MLNVTSAVLVIVIACIAYMTYEWLDPAYHEREITLGLIKPDAFDARQQILDAITANGFRIINSKELRMTEKQAQEFYKEHSERSFYNDLVKYMTSGRVLAMKLQKANAIVDWRTLMGPTDPNIARKSDPYSMRSLFGTDVTQNAVHGSDSPSSALRELEFIKW